MEDDHHHCRVCGKVCASDEEVCSKACRAKRESALRAKKNLTLLMYGGIAVLLLLFLVTYGR